MLLAPRSFLLPALCIVSLCACECGSRPSPSREWRPEDHGQPAELDPSRTPPDQAAPAEAEQGGVDRAAAALFGVSCAGCHGRTGDGQGGSRPPGAQLPDFTSADFQKSRTDAQLAEVIVNGRNMMPPFGKQVNEHGIAALVAHIRKLGADRGDDREGGRTNAPK